MTSIDVDSKFKELELSTKIVTYWRYKFSRFPIQRGYEFGKHMEYYPGSQVASVHDPPESAQRVSAFLIGSKQFMLV